MLVRAQRRGRYADDRAHIAAVHFAVFLHSDETEEVAKKLADSFNVFVGSFLEQTALERTVEIEHRSIGDGVMSDQHIPLEDFLGHHVRRPANEAVDDESLAVRCGDRAP